MSQIEELVNDVAYYRALIHNLLEVGERMSDQVYSGELLDDWHIISAHAAKVPKQ